MTTYILTRKGIAKLVTLEALAVLDVCAPGLTDTTKTAIAATIGRRVGMVLRGRAEIVEEGAVKEGTLQ